MALFSHYDFAFTAILHIFDDIEEAANRFWSRF